MNYKAIGAIALLIFMPIPQASSRAPDYDMSEEYAYGQCANGAWEMLQYPSYEECYSFAVYYYYTQVPGGRGTFLGDIPGYENHGSCGSRLCYDH